MGRKPQFGSRLKLSILVFFLLVLANETAEKEYDDQPNDRDVELVFSAVDEIAEEVNINADNSDALAFHEQTISSLKLTIAFHERALAKLKKDSNVEVEADSEEKSRGMMEKKKLTKAEIKAQKKAEKLRLKEELADANEQCKSVKPDMKWGTTLVSATQNKIATQKICTFAPTHEFLNDRINDSREDGILNYGLTYSYDGEKGGRGFGFHFSTDLDGESNAHALVRFRFRGMNYRFDTLEPLRKKPENLDRCKEYASEFFTRDMYKDEKGLPMPFYLLLPLPSHPKKWDSLKSNMIGANSLQRGYDEGLDAHMNKFKEGAPAVCANDFADVVKRELFYIYTAIPDSFKHAY